jgi:uncharacterized protein
MKPAFYFLFFFAISLSATDLDISKMRDSKTITDKVNKGFDVNAVRSSDGYTLLHYAAEIGDAKLVKFLVSKGAELNSTLQRGDTPLSTAISFGKKDVILALLDLGVDPNYKLGELDYKRSHFHYYIIKTRKIDKVVFDLFINKGADLESRDSFNETPLISAAGLDFSMTDTAKFLIKAGADIKASGKGGTTPLMAAVYIRNIDLIKTLLKAGAPVDQKNDDGNTALLSMIGMGNFDEQPKIAVMKILLEAGANINETNNDGNSVLHESLFEGDSEIRKFFVSKNADSSIVNKKGKTALDQAIINDNLIAVKTLLSIEKDINRLDKYGSTMLHSAVMNEKYELVKILIAAGANKEAKDKWGKTPAELAESLKNQKMISLLR